MSSHRGQRSFEALKRRAAELDEKQRALVLDPRPLEEPLPIGDVCAGKPGDPECGCWYCLERAKAKLEGRTDEPKAT